MNAAALRLKEAMIIRKSWIRCIAKVGNTVRAGHAGRVERGVRVRGVVKVKLTYHRHLTRWRAEMGAADSREEEAKQLPPEHQAACEE